MACRLYGAALEALSLNSEGKILLGDVAETRFCGSPRMLI